MANIPKEDMSQVKPVFQDKFKMYPLEKFPLKYSKIIEHLSHKIVQRTYENTCRELVLELSTYIRAEKLQETSVDLYAEFEYPATWWQHFKRTHFPIWLLKRYPVQFKRERQYKSHTFERYATFPNFHCESDEDRIVVKELMSER